MATIAKGPTMVGKTVSGNSPRLVYMEEGTPTWTLNLGGGAKGKSSTGFFKAGTALYLNSTHGLDVVLRGASTGSDAAKARVVGIAAENGTGVTTNRVAIYMAHPDNIFLGNTGSVTSTATATVSIVKMGEVGGASTNSSRFFPNTTSGAASSFVRFISKYEGDAYGDTFGRVYFRFLPANSLWE